MDRPARGWIHREAAGTTLVLSLREVDRERERERVKETGYKMPSSSLFNMRNQEDPGRGLEFKKFLYLAVAVENT